MKKSITFVIIIALALIGPARLGRASMGRLQVPRILSGTSAALHIPPSTPSLTAETLKTLTLAVAALDMQQSRQSARFHRLCDKLVTEVDAGGLPAGFLWHRFLKGRRVSGVNLPEMISPAGQHGKQVPFSLGDYAGVLSWMEPYLARASAHHPRAEARAGKALIVLDMEDLFASFYVCGIASYPEHTLMSPNRREYLATHPEAWVIAHNAALRHLFLPYYKHAIRVDYYSTTPTFRAFQRLIDRKRMPPAAVAGVLAGLTKLRVLAGGEQYLNQWRLSNVAWKFLNLARARKNPHAVAAIRSYIKSWRHRTRRWYVRRWLSEALREPGPAPKFMWSPPRTIKPIK